MPRLQSAVVFVFVVGFGASTANAQKVYWSKLGDGIWRANLDGSNPEQVITNLDAGQNITGLTIDATEGTIYWVTANNDDMRRAQLDGSDIEIIGSVNTPQFIAIYNPPSGGVPAVGQWSFVVLLIGATAIFARRKAPAT